MIKKCIDNGAHQYMARFSECSRIDVEAMKVLLDSCASREQSIDACLKDYGGFWVINEKTYQFDICVRCGNIIEKKRGETYAKANC